MNMNKELWVNQAIIDFWRSCNGKRKVTELVESFAQNTGLQRTQVEKEVIGLIQQLHDAGLLVIPKQESGPNVILRLVNIWRPKKTLHD